MRGKPILGYLSGPVDGREVYARYLQDTGIDYLGTSYMREFFEVCDRLDLPSVVVTSHDGETYVHRQDRTVVANFPKPGEIGGVRYHLAMMRWTAKALAFLHEQGCTHVVLTDAQDYWFCIARSPLRRAKLIVALHCAIELAFGDVRPAHRVLHGLNRRLFYRHRPDQILSASPLITRQAQAYTASLSLPVRLFLPQYDEQDFAEAYGTYPSATEPFHLLFAGRIVANKGVFDLLEVLAHVRRGGAEVMLHYAGDGPDFERLRGEVAAQGLGDTVTLHGYCGKRELLGLLSRVHAVVVPTRSEFMEGFAMICAEAILAGRPLITSKVCPALELLGPASIEAEMDRVESYANAVLALANDPALVASKRQAAEELRKPFFDRANSYGAQLEASLLATGVTRSKLR
jgi:glycosyltransferase involved in cell wall biosynthesis